MLSQELHGEMQLLGMGQGRGLGSSRVEMPGSSHQLLPTGIELGSGKMALALLVTLRSATLHTASLGRCQDQDTQVVPTLSPWQRMP